MNDNRLQFLEDIITTAVEGGIGYWSETVQYQFRLDVNDRLATRSIGTARPDAGTCARVRDLEAWDWQRYEGRDYYDITAELIQRGILAITRVHRDDAPKGVGWAAWRMIRTANECNDASEIDAGLADVIVQVGLFGEVRYG